VTVVSRALGEERAAQLDGVTQELLTFADSVAAMTEAVAHLPVPLRSRSPEGAAQELSRKIEVKDPGRQWAFATFRAADGRGFGKASPFLPAILPASQDWFITFALADLHTRLAAWFLTQVWRAAELAGAAHDSLGRWQVLVAAATARSLLEGAAAFSVEARTTIAEWDAFKRAGEPQPGALEEFAQSFNRRVVELQYASRIGQGTDNPPLFPSKNVVTYINKLAKAEHDFDIGDIYQWLCDAVHPSFGSATTFTVTRNTHATGTHFREMYACHPLEPLARTGFAVAPTVAHNAADAVIASGMILRRDLGKIRWSTISASPVGRHLRCSLIAMDVCKGRCGMIDALVDLGENLRPACIVGANRGYRRIRRTARTESVPGHHGRRVNTVSGSEERFREPQGPPGQPSRVHSRPTVTWSASARSTTRMVSPVRWVRGVGWSTPRTWMGRPLASSRRRGMPRKPPLRVDPTAMSPPRVGMSKTSLTTNSTAGISLA
jgi:hypothetical protein